MAKALHWNIVMPFGVSLTLGIKISSLIGIWVTPWLVFAASTVMAFYSSYSS
jgi:hypothetical protein